MKSEAPRARRSGPEQERPSRDFAGEFISQLRSALASGGPIEELLRNARQYAKSEKVAKLCDALLLAVQKEREAREGAFVSEMEGVCRRAGEAALKAQKAADLDPVLVELSRLRDQPQRGYTEVGRRATEKIRSTIRFVTLWQDYLAQLAAGNQKVAREKLTSLADDAGFPIVPRSEILARLNPLPPAQPPARSDMNTPAVEAIMLRINTLEDVAPAMKELRPLRQGTNSVDFEQINFLASVLSDYEQTKAGLPVSLSSVSGAMHFRRFPKLKAEFVLLLLPQHLGVGNRKPAVGESADLYLQRLTREARESSDWPLVVRVLETSSQLNGYNPQPPPEIAAVKAYISGENQYAAGQYALAVLSYQNALRDGGRMVPLEVIAARLKDIQTNHAKEYNEALERFRNPGAHGNNPIPVPFFLTEDDGATSSREKRSRRQPGGRPPQASEPTPTPPATPKISPAP
jgi:hypothetical protein